MFTRRKLLIKRIDDAFVYLQIGQLGAKIKSNAVRISWLQVCEVCLYICLNQTNEWWVGRAG